MPLSAGTLRHVLLPLLLAAAACCQAASQVVPLWPEGVPDPKALGPEKFVNGRISAVSEPALTVYPPTPDRASGTAIIVAPGGGYDHLAMVREGDEHARWLSALGVTVFVLKYRLNEFGHPAPLRDVLRAVRLVRSQAAAFHVDPARIGVMGSSAGGHLAASALTLFAHPDGRTGAALDAVSARPDFGILVYPVITSPEPRRMRVRARLCWGRSRRRRWSTCCRSRSR
jgi:acetyl esterase/lipase